MKKCIRVAVCVAILATWGIGEYALHAQTNAIASGNWSSPTTWDAGVPNDTLPAVINGGYTVTVDQAGAFTNLLDLGTIVGETGNLNITGGQLGFFDFDPVPGDPTAMRLGSVAGSTGNLTMSGGEVFIQEDIPDAFDSGDLTVGQFGTGTATITGGTLTAGDEIFIARDPGSQGTLTVNGTALVNIQRRNLLVGFRGASADDNLPGGIGTLNVGGSATVSVANFAFLGFGGENSGAGLAGASGELNVSDMGQISITGDLRVGEGPGSTAEVNVSGSGKIAVNAWMPTAFSLGSTANISQTGGEVTVSGWTVHGRQGDAIYNHSGGKFSSLLLIVGDGVDNTPAYGEYNISGTAEMSTEAIFWMGAWGTAEGVVNQSGGTVSVGALQVANAGTATYTMTGGNLTVKGTDGGTDNNHLIIGKDGGGTNVGTGYFDQSGGNVVVKTGVFLGDFDDSNGTYRISGGSLVVDGTGSHVNPGDTVPFIGDFSVGGALAGNAQTTRVEPDGNNGPQGQALGAKGTFIVSGSGATEISIAGNFLANPADKSQFRSDPFIAGGDNSATLGFEIFDNTGTTLIDVAGVADLDGAVIDLDLMDGFTPALNATFDLLRASSFGATGTGTTQNVGTGEGFSLAAEDAGGWSLAVVAGGGFETLRATFLGLVGIPGDFDNDGDVDGRDFLAWQRNPSVGSLADWQNNYGEGALAAVGAVPEPTSVALLGMLGVVAFAVHGRKAAR